MSTLLRSIARCWDRLRADQRGNVLMIFGFALIPMTIATGMTIDYARAGRLQTRLNAVSDAAALAGVTPQMLLNSRAQSAQAAYNMWYAQAGTSQCAGGTVNRVIFNNCSMPGVGYSDNGSVFSAYDGNVRMTVTDTNTNGFRRTIAIRYDAGSQNIFSNLLGAPSIAVGGRSTTTVSNTQYIDVHVALDTSQSMGLAASDADALKLWNATRATNGPNHGCTFGCHAYTGSDGGYNSGQIANDTIARNNGVRMRLDELRDATVDMVQAAIDNTNSTNFYRFALYRVGANHSTISSLTSNLSSVKTTAGTITLGPNSAAGTGDTNLPSTLTSVLPLITARGDGSTQAKARSFLFIVTDGVTDVVGSCTYGHCTRPIDPASCQAYKNAGITVGIVYTTYLPVYADPTNPSNYTLRAEYANLVKDFSDPGYTSPNPSDNSVDIKPALQACASSGWFFEAEDGAGIHTAMQTLFRQVTRSASITQ